MVVALAGGYLEFRNDSSAADQGIPQVQSTPSTVSPSLTPPAGVASGRPVPPTSTPTVAPAKPSTTSTPKTIGTPRPRSASPLRVLVPRLGVSARVLAIRARGGALIPPSNPRLVGWWSGGARPGAAKGSAIITGHTVHTGGGAFDDLDQLAAGDSVKVTTGRGTINYVVTSVTIFRKKTLATRAAQLFDQSVPGRLVLVTCEDWDGTAYLSNAVVVAKPVS
jgi:LPXTG-site transpeptidase (sortase) family protein